MAMGFPQSGKNVEQNCTPLMANNTSPLWRSNTILKFTFFGYGLPCYLTSFFTFGILGSCQIVSSKNESQDGLDTSCRTCRVMYRVQHSSTFLTRVDFVPIVHRPTPHAPGTRPAHVRPTLDTCQVLTPSVKF